MKIEESSTNSSYIIYNMIRTQWVTWNLINYNPHLAGSFSPGIPSVNQFELNVFEFFLSLQTTSKSIEGEWTGDEKLKIEFLCVDDVAKLWLWVERNAFS